MLALRLDPHRAASHDSARCPSEIVRAGGALGEPFPALMVRPKREGWDFVWGRTAAADRPGEADPAVSRVGANEASTCPRKQSRSQGVAKMLGPVPAPRSGLRRE